MIDAQGRSAMILAAETLPCAQRRLPERGGRRHRNPYPRRTMELAHAQQARLIVLRSATDLGRLWQNQDKRRDTYWFLALVYGWFTEGFDTKDLQEAKESLLRTGAARTVRNEVGLAGEGLKADILRSG